MGKSGTPDKIEFKPKNFWEAVYDRSLEKVELVEIDGNAKAFIKLMLEEQLLEKRRKLQVEIYKIDCELEDLAKNIFPVVNLETLTQKFESLLPKAKSESKNCLHGHLTSPICLKHHIGYGVSKKLS